MRNWHYFTWLSGDHNVEQHVHSLDKMAWAMKDEPPGQGRRHSAAGRSRTGPEFGHIFDHHAVVYEYANGVKLFQQLPAAGRLPRATSPTTSSAPKGIARRRCSTRITGKNAVDAHARATAADDMYQNEHDELFASIRAGKPINNGEYMAKSTLMAIMGRMATYTGQEITWEMALNSKEDLTPAKYEFGPLPTPPVAGRG